MVTMGVSVRVVTKIVPNKDITVWLYVEHVELGTTTTRLENYWTMTDSQMQLQPLSSGSGA